MCMLALLFRHDPHSSVNVITLPLLAIDDIYKTTVNMYN